MGSKVHGRSAAAPADCGGCGISTREGLPPTRFPSERHRPLGESSAGEDTGPPEAGRADGPRSPESGRPAYDRTPTPRVALTLRTSPGPEGSKDKQALAGARGVPASSVRGQ